MYMDRYQIQLDTTYPIVKSKHKQANVGSSVSAILNIQILHKNTHMRERQRQREKNKEEERGTKEPENKRERGRPDFFCMYRLVSGVGNDPLGLILSSACWEAWWCGTGFYNLVHVVLQLADAYS